MMTLDEAIKHCREVADGQLCEGTVNHKACGEEHRWLAEWLEELKKLREYHKRTIEKIRSKNVGGLEYDAPCCPNCGDNLNKWDENEYCSKCGQALLWEYPDEEDDEE